jgi:hypothetical protein
MAFVRAGVALTRTRVAFGGNGDSPSIDRWGLAVGTAGDREIRRLPEIDCLRSTVAPGKLAAAENRATALAVGADRVLIAAGALSEETYLRALGKHLGVVFEPLDDIRRTQCPIGDERLIESAAAGLLPMILNGELCLLVAPRATAARRISGIIEDNPLLARRFRFTSAERLTRFALRHTGKTLVARASGELKRAWPGLSAAPPRWRGNTVPVAFAGLVALAGLVVAPAAMLCAIELMLAAVFLAWLGLRLAGAFID